MNNEGPVAFVPQSSLNLYIVHYRVYEMCSMTSVKAIALELSPNFHQQ